MELQRKRIEIQGLVQGVGFRPFIKRLALKGGLNGFVINTTSGVTIEVEGDIKAIDSFLIDLHADKPRLAVYFRIVEKNIPVIHETSFLIEKSSETAEAHIWVGPDVSMCSACSLEIQTENERRFSYAFTNCTDCGPRFSIIEAMPYDRPLTVMKSFPMCESCMKEYVTETDRRFHAQPIACPTCGPHLWLIDNLGNEINVENILAKASEILENGLVLGLKGLGGYQLVCDATNEKAVELLRQRKNRPDKPLAVMYPDLDSAKRDVYWTKNIQRLLESPAAPIVICKRNVDAQVSSCIARDSIGVMLPNTPLHHLLLAAFRKPVICTSGNISGEPIIIKDDEALQKLGLIADYFIVHNRPIHHHIDDSVIKVDHNDEVFIRRARGYAPLPVIIKQTLPPLVALGGQQKNTIALSNDRRIIVSQHIGDLGSVASVDRLNEVIRDYEQLFRVKPTHVACDLHPEYESTKIAHSLGLPVIPVQHHHAHVAACLAENQMNDEVLGLAWDGTGLGTDGTIWGGECLRVRGALAERIGSLRSFVLLGGEKAIKEPRRIGLALLYETYGSQCYSFEWVKERFSDLEVHNLKKLYTTSPRTTSMGRLFDGIASLLGIRDQITFEGQAAMELEEFATDKLAPPFHFNVTQTDRYEIDWRYMIEEIINTKKPHLNSSRFHRTVAEIAVSLVQAQQLHAVALSGGVFQNMNVLQGVQQRLSSEGYRVLTHHQLPPNDGCLSAGQIYVAGEICA